jgi:hypothetical protein
MVVGILPKMIILFLVLILWLPNDAATASDRKFLLRRLLYLYFTLYNYTFIEFPAEMMLFRVFNLSITAV